MTVTRTVEQILALAPDPASAKNGRDLAVSRKWNNLGATDTHIWGECQGSGSSPYQTQVDVQEPAFKCSCPSRKFPCKHGLGLMLLQVQDGKSFKSNAPPPWVSQWIESRTKSAERKSKAAEKPEKSPDPAAQAKRAENREAKIAVGMDELHQWLCDVVRAGIANAPSQPYSTWEGVAARMVDAQAPGVARLIKDLGSAAASGDGWQDRMCEKLGLIFLLSQAFKHRGSLSEALKTDIRTWVGINQAQDEVLASPPVRDHWTVLGQRLEDDGRIRSQRTWLRGAQTSRMATVLHFAIGRESMDVSLAPGSVIDAELCFFPSAQPVRALVKTRHATISAQASEMAGSETIDAGFQLVAQSISANPWTPLHGLALTRVIPTALPGGKWALRDDGNAMLPVHPNAKKMWNLLAISGGEPLSIFGEWDGETILPLSSIHARRFMPL